MRIMKNRTPARPTLELDFEPVPRKYRHDGWTPERQRAFIAALANTGSVTHACARINMATEGAYYLRRAPGADSFRAAWAAALDHGVQQLADLAIDRARDGVAVPIFHRGEQVGEKRWYNDRLLMFVLKHHMPNRYGGQIGGGTRSKETIEREAAENCPACRERREWEAGEGETVDAYAEWLDGIVERYMLKVGYEHDQRQRGEWVAADFALRQLTHLELILDMGGRTQELLKHYTTRPSEHGGEHELYAGPISEILAAKREAYWESVADPPRPPVPLPALLPCSALSGGPTWQNRDATRRAAVEKMRMAQEEWEAARTEESWAAWVAGR